MDRQEVRRRFLAVIDEEAEKGGRGTIARAEADAGLRRGWLYDLRRREHIELAEALGFGRALGLEPAELAERMFTPRAAPVAGFVRRAEALPGRKLGLLEAARAWLDEQEEVCESVATKEIERCFAELEELDDLRYERASDAAEKGARYVTKALEMGELELLLASLGVFASAQRILGELETAQRALAVALAGADRLGLEASRVSLARRAVYVELDLGEYQRAAELSEWVILSAHELGDLVEIGKATVGKAITRVCQDRQREAVQLFETALELLPANAGRYRLAAFQGLGRAHLQAGDLERADHFTGRAAESLDQQRGAAWGQLNWLRANINGRRGRYDQAESLYREALRTFEEIPEPFVVALISVELVRMQIEAGRQREAVKTAIGMTALLEPLDRHRLVSAAIMDLVAAARLGILSTELTEQAVQVLERGRPELRSTRERRL